MLTELYAPTTDHVQTNVCHDVPLPKLTPEAVTAMLGEMRRAQSDRFLASLLDQEFPRRELTFHTGRFLAVSKAFPSTSSAEAQTRREVLADFLETLPPDQFSITSWQAPRYGRATYPDKRAIKVEHLRCCFGGWIEYLFSGQVAYADGNEVGALIGLSRDQMLAMFFPTDMFNRPHAYTRDAAAKVARHLANTGCVDWRVAGFSTSEGSL